MSDQQAWLITDPEAEAGGRETLPPTDGLTVITRAELADSNLRFPAGTKVAITTEAAMDEVVSRLDPGRRKAIRSLKDKAAFRELLRPLYPDLTFETVATNDLPATVLNPDATYVIKPAFGVFGAGVRTISGRADLSEVHAELVAEMKENAAVLSETALSAERLIIERYIDGEEYAVDAFFDPHGRPVITSAYHHPMPTNPAYLHMVYYTSGTVMDLVSSQAIDFLTALNDQLGMTNLAVHSEFRLEGDRLMPIEINAMRFGGMGLGNMVFHTAGVNPYRHFIDGTSPDWSQLPQDGQAIVFFIGYNGASVDPATHVPDWPGLRRRFDDIVLEVPFDHREQLAFGVLYAREPTERIPELLSIEFDDLFVEGPDVD